MSRDGFVLVEVLAAIAVLGIVGVSALGYVQALGAAQEHVLAAEAEMQAAETLVIEHALLTPRQLDQRIGVRRVGSYAVWLDRPRPAIYRVGVSPWDAPEVELLATLLHRPDSVPGGVRR